MIGNKRHTGNLSVILFSSLNCIYVKLQVFQTIVLNCVIFVSCVDLPIVRWNTWADFIVFLPKSTEHTCVCHPYVACVVVHDFVVSGIGQPSF